MATVWPLDQYLSERAASKQGEALAALREGSKVLAQPLGQNDDDQRREASAESRKAG